MLFCWSLLLFMFGFCCWWCLFRCSCCVVVLFLWKHFRWCFQRHRKEFLFSSTFSFPVVTAVILVVFVCISYCWFCVAIVISVVLMFACCCYVVMLLLLSCLVVLRKKKEEVEEGWGVGGFDPSPEHKKKKYVKHKWWNKSYSGFVFAIVTSVLFLLLLFFFLLLLFSCFLLLLFMLLRHVVSVSDELSCFSLFVDLLFSVNLSYYNVRLVILLGYIVNTITQKSRVTVATLAVNNSKWFSSLGPNLVFVGSPKTRILSIVFWNPYL